MTAAADTRLAVPIGACMTCRRVRLIAEAVTDRAGNCAECAEEEESP